MMTRSATVLITMVFHLRAEKGFPSSELIIHERARLNEDKLQHNFLKTCPKSQSIPEGLTGDEALVEHRVVALRQSLFSARLSLLVGMIVWEAENSCMPLIMALFIVVGMSLNGVIRFFSLIKNKSASDAVSLLSFNWFILGTLTYPTLPTVAHLLAPPSNEVLRPGNLSSQPPRLMRYLSLICGVLA